MDSRASENYAVNEVENLINLSEYLEPKINCGDKELSWDGHINIYKNPGKEKKNFVGRVAVQVKGTKNIDFSKDEVSFKMEVSDLENYRREGGTVLFVVYINKVTSCAGEKVCKKVYYNGLTPIDIMCMLMNLKDGQKTKSVSVQTLPHNSKAIANAMLNFYNNCRMQSSFSERPVQTFESLKQCGEVEAISTPVWGYHDQSISMDLLQIDMFLQQKTYIYAKLKGYDVSMPLANTVTHKSVHLPICEGVFVNQKRFYDSYEIVMTKREIQIAIGNSLTITMLLDDHISTINFMSPSSMKAFIHDTEFMLACLDNQGFELCTYHMPINLTKEHLSNFDIDKTREMLAFLKRVTMAFTVLNCDDDLSIDTLNDQDYINLDLLCSAFIDGQPISNLQENLDRILLLKISQLRFLLILSSYDQKPDSYTVADYFSQELRVCIGSDDSEQLDVPKYVFLHAEEFLTVSNMRFDALLPEFQKFDSHPYIIDMANAMLLDLISAYDKAQHKRKECIFDTALTFADWLLSLSDSVRDRNTALLNKLQLVLRSRSLTKDEKETLYQVCDDVSSHDAIRVGACLLLGDQHRAEYYYARLDAESRDAFKSFPIYYFWNEKDGWHNG